MLCLSFFRWRKILRVLQLFFGAVGPVFLLGLWFVYQYPEVEKTLKRAPPALISGGEIVMPTLDLTFRRLDTRPDSAPESGHIILIDSSFNQYTVQSGSKVYLDYHPQHGVIAPSQGETPLSMVPKIGADGTVSGELTLSLSSYKKEQIVHLQETAADVELKVSEGLKQYVKGLQGAKAYPPDALFKLYGGKNYRSLGNLYRLEVGGQVFFVGRGDLLVCDGGKWRSKKAEEDTTLYPLLHVAKVSEQKMELMLFDIEGKESTKIPLFITYAKRSSPSFAEIFASPRQRTPRSISCRLGGKNRILQEGDWLVQTGKGWQVIQSAEELEKLIQYQAAYDLIVLDKIERQALTGYYFDAKRTIAQKVSVPLLEEKSKKKNRPSATMESHDPEK